MSQVELSELNEGEGPECLTLPLGEASNAPKCSWIGKARQGLPSTLPGSQRQNGKLWAWRQVALFYTQ